MLASPKRRPQVLHPDEWQDRLGGGGGGMGVVGSQELAVGDKALEHSSRQVMGTHETAFRKQAGSLHQTFNLRTDFV